MYHAKSGGRIAAETLEIYVPIAHRLGLNQTYRELQDLSFRYMQPWRYTILAKAVSKARSRRRDLIQKVQRDDGSGFCRQQTSPCESLGAKKPCIRFTGRCARST